MLRRWRERKGYSVNKAALYLRVGFKEYRLWEDPDSDRKPGLESAVRLLRTCGIPPEVWVDEDPPPPSRDS